MKKTSLKDIIKTATYAAVLGSTAAYLSYKGVLYLSEPTQQEQVIEKIYKGDKQ